MNINFKLLQGNYDFLCRKLGHLDEPTQGIISEDLFLNYLFNDEIEHKYGINLTPETLFDVNWMCFLDTNKENLQRTDKIRESFFQGININFKEQETKELFLSILIISIQQLQDKKELELLFIANKEISLKFLFITTCNLYLQNNRLFNKQKLKTLIISFYGQLKHKNQLYYHGSCPIEQMRQDISTSSIK